MQLQKLTIARYQVMYPEDSLREISKKTGIQLTRLFRIMNGSEMRISEYEQFEKVFNTNTTTSTRQFMDVSFLACKELSHSFLKELELTILLSIKTKKQLMEKNNINTYQRFLA